VIDEYINQSVSAMSFFDNVQLIGAGEILFRSSDNGKYWESIDSLNFDNFRKFIQLSNDSIIAGTDRELRLSTDGGLTWKKVESWKLGAREIFKTDKRIYINTFSGLYESKDGMSTWHKTIRGDSSQISGRITARGNSIFAYQPEINKVFYSTNGGDLWIFGSVMIPDSILGTPFVASNGTHYANLKNRGIWKSYNNGFIWEHADTGLIIYPKSVLLHEDNSGNLYFSDGIRVYSSNNEGSLWRYTPEGLNFLTINAVSFNDEYIFIGTNKNGFFRKELNNTNWESTGFQLEEKDVITLFNYNSDRMLAGTYQEGCFSSNHNGEDWRDDSYKLKVYNSYPNVYCFGRNSYGQILAGSSGLFKVYDWERIENEVLNQSDVYDIENDDYGDVYVATDKGVFHSMDTEYWYLIGLKDKQILSLLIDGQNIYAGGWSEDGLYYSGDLGNSWEVRNNGLPEFTMTKQIVKDKSGIIYLATLNRGVFYTYDKGLSWRELNTGLPTGDMGALAVAPDGRIFAGTRGWGLYVLDGTVDIAHENQSSDDEIFITPNPASDYIEINLNYVISAKAGAVRPAELIQVLNVKVYDVLGSLVISNPLNPPCQGDLCRIDISYLRPGVYFVRVEGSMYKFVKI